MQYSTVKINNEQIGTYSSMSSSSSVVLVLWLQTPASSVAAEKRPVRVNFFAQHYIRVGDTQHSVMSVCVSWFNKHVHNSRYGKPCGNLILLKQTTIIVSFLYSLFFVEQCHS